MEASALDKAIKSLESSSDSLEVWLAVFTFLVVVGLVVEYWHDFIELIRKRPFDKKLFQMILGGVLITVGVAGELVIQYKASGVEAKLRAVNHLIEATLIKEADTAKARAKGFERNIATSNRAAAEAGQGAAAARLEAARANERAAVASAKTEELKLGVEASRREQSKLAMAAEELRKQNIEAAERFEAERKDRLALEEYLAPRNIGEILSFNRALHNFPGITAIFDVVRDIECRRLANSIAAGMGRGIEGFTEGVKWNVKFDSLIDDSFGDGVVITFHFTAFEREGDTSPMAAKALADLLKSRNVYARALPVTSGQAPWYREVLPPNTIHVTVGLKPDRFAQKEAEKMRQETIERWNRQRKELGLPPLPPIPPE